MSPEIVNFLKNFMSLDHIFFNEYTNLSTFINARDNIHLKRELSENNTVIKYKIFCDGALICEYCFRRKIQTEDDKKRRFREKNFSYEVVYLTRDEFFYHTMDQCDFCGNILLLAVVNTNSFKGDLSQIPRTIFSVIESKCLRKTYKLEE